jgi:D-alanyl-D-alanine carboxypeptidase (penicillin-binding protein 5/6)
LRPAPRILTVVLAGGLTATGLLAAGPASAATARATAVIASAPGPSGVAAGGAELVDSSNGRVMWGRAIDVKRPIASITKVMTALVVLKAGDLTRQIRVTAAAEDYGYAYDPGEAGLHIGDVLTTRQLLEGLLLPSGSDAAYLLATTYGPGWRRFVRKMNAEARSLGMTRTHFANFDGLPWPTEYSTYSTPHDLMLLTAAAMRSPAFRQIVSQRRHSIAATRLHHHYYWKNTNLLLGMYRGTIGIKTGFTAGAGYCLLFAARRGKHELVGVVLKSTTTDTSERFTAAERILRWGFTRLSG